MDSIRVISTQSVNCCYKQRNDMRVISVNIGKRQRLELRRRTVETGLFKEPTDEIQRIEQAGLLGDSVVSPHGAARLAQALSVYPIEHYRSWRNELGGDVFQAGCFGENLTTEGVLESTINLGDVLRVGSARLQVTYARTPCSKLNARMGGRFSKLFLRSRRVGFYLKVLEPGAVRRGDRLEVLEREPDPVTVDDFVRLLFFDSWDVQGLMRIASCQSLSKELRRRIHEKAQQAKNASGWLGQRPLRATTVLQEGGEQVCYAVCAHSRPLPPTGPQAVLPVVHLDGGAESSYRVVSYPVSTAKTQPDTYRVTVPSSQDGSKGFTVGAVFRAYAPKPGDKT